MEERFSRTSLLIGEDAIDLLSNSKVIVFGVGGVGGFCVESLVRSGIGHITIVDNDTVSKSNINRQIIALESTIGKYKVDVMKERILDINPNCEVQVFKEFVLKDNIDIFKLEDYDYVVDCIDTVTGKISIIEKAYNLGIKVISSMGAGNKLDPTKFVVTDIYKTSMCPLAKVMRHELKKRNIKKCKVVYSLEEALTPLIKIEDTESKRRQIPGSISFVPSVAGLILSSVIIKDLMKGD